ncbi:MAG TPA: hypothetical protein DCE52_18390 [Rhodobacteraceae bacterium]|nr:hypothetical protein [Paracoccaceae bacterium]
MTINWVPVKKLHSYLKNPYFNLLAAIGMTFSSAHELYKSYEAFGLAETPLNIIHGAALFGIFHAGIAIADIWESGELLEKAETSSLNSE